MRQASSRRCPSSSSAWTTRPRPPHSTSRRSRRRCPSLATSPRGRLGGLLGLAERSLTARLVGSFFVLSLVIVAALGVIAYLSARSSLEASLYERLQAVADARADGLDRWVDEQR